MAEPDFSDAGAVLARTQRRSQDLLDEVWGWVSAHRDQLIRPVVGTWDEGNQQLVFEARSFEQAAPLDWAMELRDISIGLRSVLDYAAWAMVAAGADPTAVSDDRRARRVQFPIVVGGTAGRDGASVFAQNVRACLPGVSNRQTEIVERYQPFVAQESARLHGLAVLADVSNRDKHRTLHVLLAGERRLFLPADPSDVVSSLVDVELLVGEKRQMRAQAIANGPFMNGYRLLVGARRTGPQPQAEAQLPSGLDVVVDTEQRESLDEVVQLLVEVVSEVLDELATAHV